MGVCGIRSGQEAAEKEKVLNERSGIKSLGEIVMQIHRITRHGGYFCKSEGK